MINPQKCVCCGDSWKDREPTIYKNGENPTTKSIPFIFTMSLFKNKTDKRVKLVFCDKHGNNHDMYTKTIKGVLYVRNTKTGKMRRATPLGVAV